MTNIQYRPEIDGLRAISVGGVVLFHAGLGVSGGYVGVDVFFVISGYLITSILLKNIQNGSFSMANFWLRRIRRILPASVAMSVTVLLTGILLLEPSSLTALAKSAMYQSVMLSNVFFRNDTGYFAEAAVYKPLLHTWSLSVEEQFYLIFPILLILAHKVFKVYVWMFFLVIGLISLFTAIHITGVDEPAAFFLLYTRAWEMIAGVLIAINLNRLNLSIELSQLLTATGLVLILYSMLYFDSATPFPGSSAIIPVLGATLFIVGSSQPGTYAGRLLSLKPLVFVGVISYSLYLWHWPIFSFVEHTIIDIDLYTRLSLVLVSILLAFMSWKFVENPFRHGNYLQSYAAALGFTFVSLIFLMASSTTIAKLDGLPQRFNQQTLLMLDDLDRKGSNYVGKDGEPALIGKRKSGSDQIPDFILWGDSHGMVIAEYVDRLASERGLFGEAYLSPGVIPVTNLWRPIWEDSRRELYLEQNRRIVQSAIERKISDIILIGRWSVISEGRNSLEIENGDARTDSLVTDNELQDRSTITADHASASLARQLQKMLHRLNQSGTRVWLLKQVPETDNPSNARHFYLSQRFPGVNRIERFTTSYNKHLERQAKFESAVATVSSDNLIVIDPAPGFFQNEQSMLEVFSQRSHYRDDDHLTTYGVERFLGPILNEILTKIVDAKNSTK